MAQHWKAAKRANIFAVAPRLLLRVRKEQIEVH